MVYVQAVIFHAPPLMCNACLVFASVLLKYAKKLHLFCSLASIRQHGDFWEIRKCGK